LNIHCGTLLITCGFTHYPQKREEYRFFPQDRQLPSRIVILDGDGSITLDALEWLSDQGVSLVQINWRGEVSSVGGAAYAAIPNIVEHQLELQSEDGGFEYSKWLVLEKIKHACETIKHVSDSSADAKPILKKMREQATELRNNPPENLGQLLTLEGIAAAAYFRYWYTLSLRWKGIGRKPIPQEWHYIGTRIGRSGKRNQFAVHPVNAILNYGYGVLENQVRKQILAFGADPTIGYLHSTKQSHAAFVYDLMEPVRPVMDKKILEFVLNRTFSPDDFVLNKNGIVRLHPQFARFLVKSIQDIPEITKLTELNLKRLIGSTK
jgi:CRISPR-associated endonuclease Cas1